MNEIFELPNAVQHAVPASHQVAKSASVPMDIFIPMPRYLIRYLQAIGHPHAGGSLVLPPGSDIAAYLTHITGRTGNIHKPGTIEGIRIVLPPSKHKPVHSYCLLSHKAEHAFFAFVRSEFFFDLRIFLRNAQLANAPRRAGIALFCQAHGIDTDADVNPESLYRMYTRMLSRRADERDHIYETRHNNELQQAALAELRRNYTVTDRRRAGYQPAYCQPCR